MSQAHKVRKPHKEVVHLYRSTRQLKFWNVTVTIFCTAVIPRVDPGLVRDLHFRISRRVPLYVQVAPFADICFLNEDG